MIRKTLALALMFLTSTAFQVKAADYTYTTNGKLQLVFKNASGQVIKKQLRRIENGTAEINFAGDYRPVLVGFGSDDIDEVLAGSKRKRHRNVYMNDLSINYKLDKPGEATLFLKRERSVFRKRNKKIVRANWRSFAQELDCQDWQLDCDGQATVQARYKFNVRRKLAN
jgi:hypothetical protein